MRFIKEMSGNSGCKLYLIDCDGGLIVRKISGSQAYNDRLKAQFEKQKNFRLDSIKTPEIFGSGLENGLFYFDMQYLNCKTLAEYIRDIEIHEIDKFANIFLKSVPANSSNCDANAQQIFGQKIQSLATFIKSPTDVEKKAFKLLENFDYSKIPHTPCCGDLTLENVLISTSGEIFLIDFLDSFFDSWIIDAAKIFQDIELQWSYRKGLVDANLAVRLLIAKQKISDGILAMNDGKYKLTAVYYALMLNVLRIKPYVKDAATENFIQNSLNKITNIIEKTEA